MSVVSLRSVLKNLLTTWWFPPLAGFASSFAIPLLLPHLQWAKTIRNVIYPESGWIGAVTFRLTDVPGYTGKNDLDLILFAHHLDSGSRVTFIRDGVAPECVAAGAAATSLVMDVSKPRTSGIPLFDVDLPPETLVATSVLMPRGASPPRYVVATSDYTRELSSKGDLIVLTRNQLRNTRITYGLALLALALAAVFMPRYAHLLHPDDPDAGSDALQKQSV